MANVFGILTAVVLALAAFVAFKNKDAYANELSHRKTEESKLAATEKRLSIARADLAATTKKREDTQAEVVKLRAEETEHKTTNSRLTADIDGKKKTVAANKKELDGIREKTSQFGPITELEALVKGLRDSLANLKEEIATNETKLTGLMNENVRVEGVIEVLNTHNSMVSRKESYFTKTRINSIYPNWGFVTLGAGITSGVVSGSTLEVVRGGTSVAKLLVTAVETNTASASIVPGSLAKDAVLMVGDQVVAAHPVAKQPAKDTKPKLPKAPAKPKAGEADPGAAPSLEGDLGATPKPDPSATPDPAATPAEPEVKPGAEADPGK